jgi:hypothetical protein
MVSEKTRRGLEAGPFFDRPHFCHRFAHAFLGRSYLFKCLASTDNSTIDLFLGSDLDSIAILYFFDQRFRGCTTRHPNCSQNCSWDWRPCDKLFMARQLFTAQFLHAPCRKHKYRNQPIGEGKKCDHGQYYYGCAHYTGAPVGF